MHLISSSHPGRVPAKILSFTMPQPPWCWSTGGWETLRLRSFILLYWSHNLPLDRS